MPRGLAAARFSRATHSAADMSEPVDLAPDRSEDGGQSAFEFAHRRELCCESAELGPVVRAERAVDADRDGCAAEILAFFVFETFVDIVLAEGHRDVGEAGLASDFFGDMFLYFFPDSRAERGNDTEVNEHAWFAQCRDLLWAEVALQGLIGRIGFDFVEKVLPVMG